MRTKFLEKHDYFPFIQIDIERLRKLDIHFYTDNKFFIFICVNNISNLIDYKNQLLELKNNYHVLVYYLNGDSSSFNVNTTREKQLENLLEVPSENFKVYILSANRRIKDILNLDTLDSLLEIDIKKYNENQNVPYLLIENVLSEELLKEVVEYYENNKDKGELQNTATKNRTHVFPNYELEKKIDNKLSRSLFPEIKKMYNFDVYYREHYKICSYDAETNGRFHPHRDSPYPQQHRKYAMSLFLNDDYENGEFELTEYNLSVKPKANSAFIFPGICSHMVHPVTKGKRQTIIAFFCEKSSNSIERLRVHSNFFKENNIEFSPIYPFTFTYAESENQYKEISNQRLDNNIKLECKELVKKRKYLINRSSILKKILNSKGWIEGKIDEEVDFSYWDIVDAKGVKIKSKIELFPRNITNRCENKRIMYDVLKKNNLDYFLPKTYIDLKNLDKTIFDSNKIFFLKTDGGNGGRDVHAINTYEKMIEIMQKKSATYILQDEVPNMYLENGYKSTIRIYILVTEELKLYIYKEGKIYIHKEKYTKDNLDDIIHNAAYNSNYHYFTKMDYYDKVFNKIKELSSLSIKPFFENIKVSDSYHIMGFDFILDNELMPYLIEINTYPNVAPGTEIVTDINTRMLEDFVTLYLEPKINKTEPIFGNWELI